ncbi:hypothetical protein AOL_s00088g27 [Orbilia oligospora ATCC 24927]|uniref:Uncharacterized protein n=2 Tax=Orbilia oligospora TaxID=2813651 RepID=G1XHR4_ARTOA|nr:hypothetical protein AOL_s00088g27 [Orbilia oligospora ATCC 24927]EGX47312.1 hypothetical protein AOL_s00088g27 [Orbilia oligospora ATCC 24927]KAF3270575.1 hypothetical protein TWF970_010778 [Orbilia oligospora]
MADGFDWRQTILLTDADASTSTSESLFPAPISRQDDGDAQYLAINKIANPDMARVREILRIPEDSLKREQIQIQYPEWPADVSAKGAWKDVLTLLKDVVDEFANGVMINGKMRYWDFSKGYSYDLQASDVQVAVVKAAYDALYSKTPIEFVVKRLERCKDDWALEYLLNTRARAHKRRESRAARGAG